MAFTSRFLDEQAKQQYFFDKSGYEQKSFPHRETFVAYEGCEYVVYKFDKEGKLVIDSFLLCTHIFASNHGIRVTLIDKRSYRMHTVGDIPNMLAGHNTLAHIPTRCTLTKTVRSTRGVKKLEGLTAAIHVLSKSDPHNREPGHVQVVTFSKKNNFFTDGEFDLATARIEAELLLED